MLEDQVAYLLQRYLGNYVRGLNREALKISVWQGDVELTNMQLKPESLNALKLPVKVKAGFLGSVKLKVPWSKLGQEPVLVYLDRIFLLAEPATQVEGYNEDAVQEVKKIRIQEMEMKLLESGQLLKTKMNKSWMGSLINTVIGNLKLSISNIHIRYEDLESNIGHPFAAGIMLQRLSAVTVDDDGKETFVTGGSLERIQKSVELEQFAVYLDSDITPWYVDKPWKDLLPTEWSQIFKFGTKDGKLADELSERHDYILQPVSGNAWYLKQRPNESAHSKPHQKASVNLDDVTLCLSKNGYRDLLKLADNFAAFNQRLKYAHYRPLVSVKSDARSWWKYACKVISDQMKKASGKLSWEQLLKYARLRKRYISLYASLLKSDLDQAVVDDNKEIEELDRELDIDLILQWRLLAHKFVEQSTESGLYLRKKKAKIPWWSFGWSSDSVEDENESGMLTEEDWKQLNKIIGYKEGDDELLLINHNKGDMLHTALEVHMKHNASKLTEAQECLAELSCENLDCFIKLYPETKVFDMKLGSYRLSSPNGLLAKSATSFDSLVGVFCYKPFDAKVDWSMVAKASPCYVTYLKDSVDQIVNFFESNAVVSQTIALETAAALQSTIDEVKRTAQQMSRALKDHARFFLDLDIAAPKIAIPTDFCPDGVRSTKLLLDLGNLTIRTQDDFELDSPNEVNMYLQFDLVLSDVSAFLVDGDYHWSRPSPSPFDDTSNFSNNTQLPIIDKCGAILKLQQIRSENPSYPSARLALWLPSLGFHFSPARYHRLMEVAKIFQKEGSDNSGLLQPWNQADFVGWLAILTWKGVGGREAVWQRRYLCLVGPFLYVLESAGSTSYRQYLSLRGKQIYQVPAKMVGNIEHVLALCDAGKSNRKVVEDSNALILLCDTEESMMTWLSHLQGAIYRTSVSPPISGLSEASSESEESGNELFRNHDLMDFPRVEKLFMIGVLDELKICFNYNGQHNRDISEVLLAQESRLFEFRARGGRVELSVKANDIFIGTVLKTLELEDLVCRDTMSQPCYLARSIIQSVNVPSVSNDTCDPNCANIDSGQSEGDDTFYEVSEHLSDSVESPVPSLKNIPKYQSGTKSSVSGMSAFKTSTFNRVAGLLPSDTIQPGFDQEEVAKILDSFVKAQIVIYDQNSQLYNNLDNRVTVTLATLSFYCRRPTIVAIMAFVNAINVEVGSLESFSDSSGVVMSQHDVSGEDVIGNEQSDTLEKPVVKGLLGKGKSRIIFYLTLNMARAQIFLMKEDGTKLATFLQENFLTDIKVFPSSFSIKASLGNLRISDDNLHSNNMYFWACDMRNPGGNSFVELVFSSFCTEEDDYEGYDYSLHGQLSEVRIVYLNRFIQEIVSYFMGLIPNESKDVVKVEDQASSSEKWLTRSEIEGSPAVKLDLSLRKPIILMPRKSDSLDYLKLDIVHITVQNTFQLLCGNRSDVNAIHLEILTVMVEDINLNVGSGGELGESIIEDVHGISVTVKRSLRDLLHQLPSTEIAVKVEELKAALSSREYQIIMECTQANFSETPNFIPPLQSDSVVFPADPLVSVDSDAVKFEVKDKETWIVVKVSVIIDVVELSLHYGFARDVPLATMQISGLWLLYKSNTLEDGFLSATVRGFAVLDDREGIEQELRMAIRRTESITYGPSQFMSEGHHMVQQHVRGDNNLKPIPSMLILDSKFSRYLTSVSLCLQRPQLLVALDFLLAVVEFFVPTVGSLLLNEEDENSSHILDAIILVESTYCQPSAEFSLSPQRPLLVDDEKFDHFIYDGKGGTLFLQDRQGLNLTSSSREAIIYVGSGKRLQFKNVTIRSGQFLDSCILLGSNSCYFASEDDKVYLMEGDEGPTLNSSTETTNELTFQSTAVGRSTEFVIELQAIGPELTFYNTSKHVEESMNLSSKVLHAELDAFFRFVLKGDTIEMSANALGFTMEGNGIKILEPFDTCMKFSNASGKTHIHLDVSDIMMNFSFSILRLFMAVEEDILSFLRMTSKKMTVLCSEFDKIGTMKYPACDQIYAFWRARAPPGFAVFGDYLTPVDKPPTKGVIAVNTSLLRVKRPLSFKLVCPLSPAVDDISNSGSTDDQEFIHNATFQERNASFSIWFPEAPEGYVTLGCVASPGNTPPPLSSVFCILASLVSPCALRDCITIRLGNLYPCCLAFWRVENSVGTFLPADPTSLSLTHRAYELRHIFFDFPEMSLNPSSQDMQIYPTGHDHRVQSESALAVNSGRRFEALASFRLIWWNQGSGSRKKISIWRPVVPQGMVYFGDIAVNGYEPPNTCVALHDSANDELFKAPLDFQLVGQIKKHRGIVGISFWLPQAPPGFVSLGCVACKGLPKEADVGSLRCSRSDMVIGDQFSEESIWDTSDVRFTKEPFSIWQVGNELATFIVRSGFKKPPRRFALKLAEPDTPSSSDNIVVDAEMKTFSVALFDDYGELMVPLCNISLSSVVSSLRGRPDYLNSTVNFSLSARSFNDKYESWEPLIEPVDGLLRYHCYYNAPVASQLRLTSTRELNLNVSASNVNMILQAYASWDNLSNVRGSSQESETFSPYYTGGPIIDVHHKRNYYIIPQNRLGQDIFIRSGEIKGLTDVTRMPSGDVKHLKVPVSKNILDSHFKIHFSERCRAMVTIIIAEAEIPTAEGLSSHQYTAAVRLTLDENQINRSIPNQQSARTCGMPSEKSISSDLELVKWNEIFFFKADSSDCCMVELMITDMGKGDPVGYFSAPLRQIVVTHDNLHSYNLLEELKWVELRRAETMNTSQMVESMKGYGRIRCALILSLGSRSGNSEHSFNVGKKSGIIQISPSMKGPWTTVRLNYTATAAACPLGNDVVASEVSVKDGNRYITIRSLVSVCNNTDFTLDLCLKLGTSSGNMKLLDDVGRDIEEDGNGFCTSEFFETEKYDPTIGWISCVIQPGQESSEAVDPHQESCRILPPGWEWVDDWRIDNSSVKGADGWVYGPDFDSLKWPESHNPLTFVNSVRQRRWIRYRKRVAGDVKPQIFIGTLNPGETVSLPLSGLTQTGLYVLKLRPSKLNNSNEYSWSTIMDAQVQSEDFSKSNREICVSTLSESQDLLHCSKITGSSSSSQGLWFCLAIQATEIAKDIHSKPIQDWTLVVKSPLAFGNYLPFIAEFSVLEEQANGHFLACSRGIFNPGKTVKIYDADIRNPLYLSLLPQKGWQPIHEAVLFSHPNRAPSKTISLRSSISGRIVQIILEPNHRKEPLEAYIIRLYSPYWFAIARCPPLTFRLVEKTGRKQTRKMALPFHSKNNNEVILEEITEEEIYDGYTIDSALNFKYLGLSTSIAQSGKEHFGPVKDLSPLNDMDGSLDLCAYDADSNCVRLFVSSKPCPYQSIPTKVINIRPYMTFTNRLGQSIYVKLSNDDEMKVLHAFDARVSLISRETRGPDRLQVRLENSEWSFPVEIIKEATLTLVLRNQDGTMRFIRTEIRGFEEGSRFVVVFRLGSANGPIRIENRTSNKILRIRQSGFDDDAWIQLKPLSTVNYSWENPYGEKHIDTGVQCGSSTAVFKFDLEKLGFCLLADGGQSLCLHVVDVGNIKVARFFDEKMLGSHLNEGVRSSANVGKTSAPLEIIVELGVLGVSFVDHVPKEFSYLYLERVFVSYLSGYDGGTTTRFKLMLGQLQLDNQLPLTVMPVLLVPEQTVDLQHPVFKMTLTTCNKNLDGVQVYPYVYIRVTEEYWRLSIHEPIIWALIDFYNNLHLDRVPQNSNVSQVDPEIRVDLIDISEVRLKVSLETAAAQRPHGVLGVWSPILSAIGNAFKIQVHFRKVMHRDRFMRKSSVLPAIKNRIWRDLVHNPLHLIFSVDVLGMTSSTLASLSKGFAELSTDGQFLQLRSKQVWSRRITGVSDGIVQGTEALAQGFAFGVSGVVTKPVESARQNGLWGLAHGLGQALVGFIVQPMSGALDFFSLTVDGIGASCSKCLEILNKRTFQRIRNPRAIHADKILREYCEREAVGQMVLYLAEASRHFGCTEIFKEPSKFAWSDYYEDYFLVPYRRIVLVTNKRAMLLQCMDLDKMDKKPCKILWDVPWEELMELELAKAGYCRPSHVLLHLKNFRRSEPFVRVIKCSTEEESEVREPQAVIICSVVRKMWKAHQSGMKSLTLKVPSSQRHVCFACTEADWGDRSTPNRAIMKPRDLSSSSASDERKFVKHSINFLKVWSSEQESKSRCTLCRKQISDERGLCSIWRPVCPEGFVSVGDVAHIGSHPPNVAAVYRKSDKLFSLPVGYDLIWRNCPDDYTMPVSIWHPRAPEGYISPGCVAVASFVEPEPDSVYCVSETLSEEAAFEEQKIWSAPDSYPWACHIYQVQSDALHFVALRQPREESEWKPTRVLDESQPSQ